MSIKAAKNILVIFDPTDSNRVIDIIGKDFGYPSPMESSSYSDSSSYDYVVGIYDYDQADFDSSSGLLTAAVANENNIPLAERHRYRQGKDFTIALDQNRRDYLYDASSVSIVSGLRPLLEREQSLEIWFNEFMPGGIPVPIKLDEITNTMVKEIEEIDTSNADRDLILLVKKVDADGNDMTTADDLIHIESNHGIIEVDERSSQTQNLSYQGQLVDGQLAFKLKHPRETVRTQISAMSTQVYPPVSIGRLVVQFNKWET